MRFLSPSVVIAVSYLVVFGWADGIAPAYLRGMALEDINNVSRESKRRFTKGIEKSTTDQRQLEPWLEAVFVLEAIDTQNRSLRVKIAGTSLVVDGLLLSKEASVWVAGGNGQLTDLRPGMLMSLRPGTEPQLIIGIRADEAALAESDAAIIDQLIRQLASEEFEKREAAMKSLQEIGRPALTALRQAATSDDFEVRTRVRFLIEAQVNSESMWHCSLSHDTPPDPAKPCSAKQVDDKLYFTNEFGTQTETKVRLCPHEIEVTALNWEGGLTGRVEIEKDEVRIKWANGSKWTHKRDAQDDGAEQGR